jgi:hypothetical protein
MESKLRFGRYIGTPFAGTTGTASRGSHRPFAILFRLNHLVSMVAMVAIFMLFAAQQTNMALLYNVLPGGSDVNAQLYVNVPTLRPPIYSPKRSPARRALAHL